MEEARLHLTGGCQCGAVRYAVDAAPSYRTVCHCTICRRSSGAPMVAWFTVPVTGFRLLAGEPASFRSSAMATRTFCGRCGTPITFRRDGLDEVDVTACSLDDPEAVPPEDHTFVRSALGWARGEDGLPRFPAERGSAGNPA